VFLAVYLAVYLQCSVLARCDAGQNFITVNRQGNRHVFTVERGHATSGSGTPVSPLFLGPRHVHAHMVWHKTANKFCKVTTGNFLQGQYHMLPDTRSGHIWGGGICDPVTYAHIANFDTRSLYRENTYR